MAKDIRELRLAVVCYGGVSLAIYMHGMTKEIHKLVRASAALDGRLEVEELEKGSEALYHALLSRIAKGEGAGGPSAGTELKVVVDVISGTSAGGINGIFLAKALANNTSQNVLKDLWFQKGDIRRLLRGWRWLPLTLRGIWIAKTPHRIKPPLRGDDMCRWLYDALEDMDPTASADGRSLMPKGQDLQLFVPVTDFYGYDREIPLYDPRFILDRTHRHVMEFRHGEGEASQLSGEYNHMLAFAARATSSFPGAFPPISFRDYERAVPGATLDGGRRFFPFYHEVPGFDPARTHFIDGGVLDNFPFRSAIEAIASRRAGHEVDRRLVYIEPDPGEEKASDLPPAGPGVLATVLGGYAGIPRKEPILDDMVDLARRNEHVLRVRDVIAASFDSIRKKDTVRKKVDGALRGVGLANGANGNGSALINLRSQFEAQAITEAEFAAATYLRVRLRTMIETYAEMVCTMLELPVGSPRAAFVTSVFRQWAAADGLLDQSGDAALRRRQIDFLSALDLKYHERRIHFLIAAVSWVYGETDPQRPPPPRSDLDRMKHELYDHVASLSAILEDVGPGVREKLSRLFFAEDVRQGNAQDERQLKAFVKKHEAELVSLRETVTNAVSSALPAIEERLLQSLSTRIGTWPEWFMRDLLTRYVGFPFWDVLVFPLEAMSGVRERDHVEVYRMSPVDAKLLVENPERRKTKLEGMKLGHFGAFFDRGGRERDYLWGRLDAAERLVKLLLDARRGPRTPAIHMAPAPEVDVDEEELKHECLPVFQAILDEERGLKKARKLSRELRKELRNVRPKRVDQLIRLWRGNPGVLGP